MASAETSEIFNCTPEQFFAVISDYEKYPQFIKETSSLKVLKKEGDRKLVEFKVSMVKDFTYRLWMTESKNKSIVWDFEGGDLFKTQKGHWKLEPYGKGQTKAHYMVDATFTMFVPGPIAKALVSVNLPNMMKAYHGRIKELYGA